ncbi:MAG: DJ-1/PfpI family protein [Oscillospiraceae bacterium]|jgi:4-methyl-5(b-hydroxyethyl)-thiazole monophosphate biosynthesis|nr:DJ-1/PfpI family protein [Oscillospiraceae bacterium]
MIYIFFAEGFEEIEAVATLDLLRRAGLPVKSVGLGGRTVAGSHGISVVCDISEEEFDTSDLTAVILPGGPGTANLEKSRTVQGAIRYACEKDLLLCAICAAPSILGRMGLFKGRPYTCYPGCEEGIEGNYRPDRVVRDKKLITAKGPGCAVLFGLEIVEALLGKGKRKTVEAGLQ